MVDYREENLLEIFKNIAEESGFDIRSSEPLYGGDINRVYLLKTGDMPLVLKMNESARYPGMFEAEMKGLQLLKHKTSFRIPEVLGLGEVSGHAYLLLEYIIAGDKPKKFWIHFAESLVKMHLNTQDSFGLDHTNYIGGLIQGNETKANAGEYYISERLEPMLKISHDRGYNLGDTDTFLKNVIDLIPDEVPALLHGDLWNGNLMISEEGEAVLIDPAVSYGSREMDLSMMKLFGGFPEEVFKVYNEQFPLEDGWARRVKIWQLYYILVHLNIFGAGYLASAKSIISKFS